MRGDTFRMNPVSLFALIGGVVAFVVTGAIVDVLWVALGVALGAGIGYVVRRWGGKARTYAESVDLTENATKAELMEEARRLEIEGRSQMAKDELARAVSERRSA